MQSTMLDNRSPLDAALADQPWAFSGVLIGMDHIRDDNGRPLGERRAPAESRRDVPIELVTCPYHDERRGKLMNRSALEPTMRQFTAVVADVMAFHAAMPPGPLTWPRVLAGVLDQLAAPARYLLERRTAEGPVPPDLSAGHKLAAGYFGALRTLFRGLIAGTEEAPEVSAAWFGAFVRQRGALFGASEVCAGPLHNIQVLTQLFFHGALADGSRPVSREARPLGARLPLAELLARQVLLGLVYQMLDEVTERELLLDNGAARKLRARTAYLEGRLADRAAELLEHPAPRPEGLAARLATIFEPRLCAALAELLAPPPDGELVEALRLLLAAGDASILLDADEQAGHAQRFAAVLGRHQRLLREQWRIERELRGLLGYREDAGFKLNAMLCPRPRALEWFDAFSGHRLEAVAGEQPVLTARNHRRVIELPARVTARPVAPPAAATSPSNS